MPYLIKRKNVYYAQRKVPKGLEAAVAVVLRQGKKRQSYLLRSLGTDMGDRQRRLTLPKQRCMGVARWPMKIPSWLFRRG
jgi:hypothetical protein